MTALWGESSREWAERYSEGVNAAISPATLDLDWSDEYDREDEAPAAQRIFYNEWNALPGISFRSAVTHPAGLLRAPLDDSLSPLDVALTAVAPR